MADQRRRTVGKSGIPVPGSVSRSTSGSSRTAQGSSRATASRASVGLNNLPATVGRTGSSLGLPASTGRKSVMRSEYAPPSSRRSSSFRRSNIQPNSMGGLLPVTTPLAGPISVNLPKLKEDPRDTRSKEVKARHINGISAFLRRRGYTFDNKLLNSPTQPQFQALFQYIISCVNPAFKFESKRFEDDFFQVLRALRYPFVENFTKTQIQAVGSLSHYHNVLAMLYWIVTLADSAEVAFLKSPELQVPLPVDPDNARADLDAIHPWIEYIGASYSKFMASDDYDVSRELAHFHERIEASRENLKQTVAALEEADARADQELARLKEAGDPLATATVQIEMQERDHDKFIIYNNSITKKREETQNQIENILLPMKEKYEAELSTLENELARLTSLVDAQGLAPTEVQQLTSERDSLSNAVAGARSRQKDLLEETCRLQIKLQQELDSTALLVRDYESTAQNLGLLPQPPEEYAHISFEQALNPAADNPVPDCQTVIKPALVELREKARIEIARVNQEDVNLEGRIIKLQETIAEDSEALVAFKDELDVREQKTIQIKETTNSELAILAKEIEKTQTQVHNASTTMSQMYTQAQSRLDQRTLERKTVEEESKQMRIQNREALENSLDTIVTYKEDMTRHIENLVSLAMNESHM